MNEYESKMKERVFGRMSMPPIEEKDWVEFVLNCVVADICPGCGSGLHRQQDSSRRPSGEPRFYMCIYCGWSDYV